MNNHKLQSWKTLGQIVPGGGNVSGYTHASHPTFLKHNNRYYVLYAMRDEFQRSSVFQSEIAFNNKRIAVVSSSPIKVLDLGKTGTFDSHGMLPCSTINLSDGRSFLYYSGWNNLEKGVWLCDTGLAVRNVNSVEFNRLSDGPLVSRCFEHPYFVALTAVMEIEKGVFYAWFNRGLSWYEDSDGEKKCRYGIHFGKSLDGIKWDLGTEQVIPFLDKHEHSFGRPSVIRNSQGYQMWFSHRGDNKNSVYRMGYAFSDDGISWERNDSLFNLQPSGNPGDFDSHSMSYPDVFEHEGIKYMLYSGNEYGKSGFGYAIMEK